MLLNKLKLQKDYSLICSGYQLKLPLNIDTIIPSDDSVRLLSQFEALLLIDQFDVRREALAKAGQRFFHTCFPPDHKFFTQSTFLLHTHSFFKYELRFFPCVPFA